MKLIKTGKGRNVLKEGYPELYAKIEKDLENERVRTLEELERLDEKDEWEYKEKYGNKFVEEQIRSLIRFIKLPEKERIKKLRKGLSKPPEY